MTENKRQRKVSITPQHGQIEIRWYLIGDKGAVDFHIHTCSDRMKESFSVQGNVYAGGVEMHSPTPIYEGQFSISGCKIIGGDCYPDGSSLYAMEKVFPDFMRLGEEAIWQHLEETYDSRFKENETP